jgi:hypothetical protein
VRPAPYSALLDRFYRPRESIIQIRAPLVHVFTKSLHTPGGKGVQRGLAPRKPCWLLAFRSIPGITEGLTRS